MYSGITACVVLLTLVFYNVCEAQTVCTTSGWFGPNCQYQCHCTNDADCDKVDGSCSSGCQTDWFGPACQYARMSFTDVSSYWWLTDTNDGTCNTGSPQSVTVTLDTPIPITWVRVVVSNAEYLNQFTLTYQTSTNSLSLICPDPGTAQVDDTTLDIRCSTTDIAQRLSLSGTGVQVLCSLYINGGRNVALKQTAEQSSRYIPTTPEYPVNSYGAGNAVDGGMGVGADTTGIRSTCTHTRLNIGPGWWTVTFSQPVDITWFLIYNRDGDFGYRLAKFRLTVQQESSSSATVYTYTEPDTAGQATYTVVPPPSDINFPVSQVRFDARSDGVGADILTLCEVLVYGETSCPPGQFGLRCERQCNCVNGGDCFVHSGGCPSGCAPGYTGEDCYSECGPGKYGAGCGQTCSVHCSGTGDPCDHITGRCTMGCDAGYIGDKCDQECPAGSYGSGCSSRCSVNCAGPDNSCHHVTGTCDAGCDVGFYGYPCTSQCNSGCAGSCDRVSGFCDGGCYPGYYGDRCGNECSTRCFGSPTTCDRVSGACHQCNPGFYGRFCSIECNVNCAGLDNTCSGVNGVCDTGCDPGYWGDTCSYSCNSNCGGLDKTCDGGTGACASCNPGYYGAYCSNLCSRSCGGPDHACDLDTGDCNTCDPGYKGTACADKCHKGTYGAGCGETCSEHCAGDQNSCDHVNGTCDLGCDPGYQGATCTQARPQESQESEESGLNIWGIIATVVAVVAVVIAAGFVILWRRSAASRQQSQGSANKGFDGGMELRSQKSDPHGKRQRPPQQNTAVSETPYEQVDANIIRPGDSAEARPVANHQGTYISGRPNQHYETITESDPQYTHAFDTGFDHNDSPANIARDYENPLPLTVGTESSSQEMDETEQAAAGTGWTVSSCSTNT